MLEHNVFEISEIERDYFVKGPVEVVCMPKGFNRWCTLPYARHPKGCPNFGQSADCPPTTPHFLDVYKPEVYIAAMRFNFKEFIKSKKQLHPDWTLKAITNVRHFQTHLDSKLRSYSNSKLAEPGFEYYQTIYSPEAAAINIHLTMRKVGIELEWPPRENMYRIALFATPK